MDFLQELRETIGLHLPVIILSLYAFAVVFTVFVQMGGSNG